MVFKKVGDAKLEKVMCGCGGEIINGKCNKCSGDKQPVKKDEKEKKDG